MLKVGITGGIGSGKSTVASVFSVLGVPVYNSDLEARRLMNEDLNLKGHVMLMFGSGIYDKGLINSKLLASFIFGDTKLLNQFNTLVHPYVIEHFDVWCANHILCPYVIKESAIMFETGSTKGLNFVIGIKAKEKSKILRVVKRSGLSVKQVRDIMSFQLKEKEKMKKCDFVITNDDNKIILSRIIKIHEHLLSLGKRSRS